MFTFTPISINDFFNIGIVPFALSVLAAIGKIMLQAYRFKYFVDKFLGYKISSTFKIMVARLGGEFVTQTTPSYVGGEIVRIAWLTKHGVNTGKAAWITTLEIIADVFVGTILGIFAGCFAILNGANLIGFLIIFISLIIFAFWAFVLLYSAKRIIQLPEFIVKLLIRFLSSERSKKIITFSNATLADLCTMSRENLNSRETVKTISIGIGITFAAFLLFGFSFLVLIQEKRSDSGLVDSLLGTTASTQLGSLPITLGGTGLAELGLWAYISDLNAIPSLHEIANDHILNIIIMWRIASYHIPLIIMWISLMKITVSSKPKQKEIS